MSPTERLRKMLDERGVIWDSHSEPRHTWFDSPTMGRIIVFEMQTGGLIIKPEPMTPEQVIAATLPESDAGGRSMRNATPKRADCSNRR